MTSAVLPGQNSQQIGPTLHVDGQAHHHLTQVRPVIFVVAAFAQALPAFAFEVKRGRIEEHQVDFSKQVASTLEKRLLQLIFHAAHRGRFRICRRGNFLS